MVNENKRSANSIVFFLASHKNKSYSIAINYVDGLLVQDLNIILATTGIILNSFEYKF